MVRAHRHTKNIRFWWGSSLWSEAICYVLSCCWFFVISVLCDDTVMSDRIDGGQGVEVKQQQKLCTWFTVLQPELLLLMRGVTRGVRDFLEHRSAHFCRSDFQQCYNWRKRKKYPLSHLLPQVVLSLQPTHIVHPLVFAATTNALTDCPNPADDSYKLELMQCSCYSVFPLPVGWTHIP